MEDKKRTEYAIKQVGNRYYPVIIDKEGGVHYEIKKPLTGGVLSYKKVEAAEIYIERARVRIEKIIAAVLKEAHTKQVEEAMDTLDVAPERLGYQSGNAAAGQFFRLLPNLRIRLPDVDGFVRRHRNLLM